MYNGARCDSYRWSQSRSDLEVRVSLERPARYEDISVEITARGISIELGGHHRLIQGEFVHPIKPDSVYWLIDNEERCIVVFLDKVTPLWWDHLLKYEKPTQLGPRDYRESIEHLDDGARMAIDRLVTQERNKLLSKKIFGAD